MLGFIADRFYISYEYYNREFGVIKSVDLTEEMLLTDRDIEFIVEGLLAVVDMYLRSKRLRS